MPGAPPRRSRQPRPQTLRCRYEDTRGRCRSIATIEGQLCQRHAQLLANQDPLRAAADRLGDMVGRMFGGRDREVQEMMGGVAGAGILAFADYLRRRAAGGVQPHAVAQEVWERIRPGAAQPPPPPRPEPSELAEAQRARRILGFPSSGPLELAQVRDRKRELARKHHPDLGGSVEKMQEINAAADLLERHLAAA